MPRVSNQLIADSPIGAVLEPLPPLGSGPSATPPRAASREMPAIRPGPMTALPGRCWLTVSGTALGLRRRTTPSAGPAGGCQGFAHERASPSSS